MHGLSPADAWKAADLFAQVCREQGIGYCGATKTYHLRSEEFGSWLPHPDGDNALRRAFATAFRVAAGDRGLSLLPEHFSPLADLVRGMPGVALQGSAISL